MANRYGNDYVVYLWNSNGYNKAVSDYTIGATDAVLNSVCDMTINVDGIEVNNKTGTNLPARCETFSGNSSATVVLSGALTEAEEILAYRA